jgi:hypothetical protein
MPVSGVDLTVTLLIGNVRVRDLQYPVITADGVTVDKFSQPTEGSEVIDGQRYHTVCCDTTNDPGALGDGRPHRDDGAHRGDQPPRSRPALRPVSSPAPASR